MILTILPVHHNAVCDLFLKRLRMALRAAVLNRKEFWPGPFCGRHGAFWRQRACAGWPGESWWRGVAWAGRGSLMRRVERRSGMAVGPLPESACAWLAVRLVLPLALTARLECSSRLLISTGCREDHGSVDKATAPASRTAAHPHHARPPRPTASTATMFF